MMRMFFIPLILLFAFSYIASSYAKAGDSTLFFTLKDVIELAHIQSPEKLSARHKLLNKYWQYRSFRAKYLPELILDTDIFDYKRTIIPVQQASGQPIYRTTQNATSALTLGMNQNVGLSGGRLFVSSYLQRIDYQVDTSVISFLTNPVVIGFRQPLFAFNSYRWEKKIEPLIFEEAKRTFLENSEEVTINAVNYFFKLYMARINYDISKINQANNDTMYKIAVGRYNLGKIAENELLQLELNLLNSDIELAEAELNVQVESEQLKNFLGIKENVNFVLIPPENIPEFKVDVDKALGEAKKDRRKFIEFERKLLEADRNVARAKGENRFNINIVGSYGLTKTASLVENSYLNPDEMQQVSLGLQVPILDWGKRKGQVKMAVAARDLVKTNVNQEMAAFDQKIYLNVMKFNMQPLQLKIAKKADTIAQKRYFVSKKRYMIGKIAITDLSIALQEKDEARRSYVNALKTYWIDYYGIRKLTLYDFEKNRSIEFDYNEFDY